MLYNSQLDTFIAVAEAGSFSKKAKDLFISTQAVIKQINTLETELDMRLLDRSPKGITLTLEGQMIFKEAKYLVQYNAEVLQRACQLTSWIRLRYSCGDIPNHTRNIYYRFVAGFDCDLW